MTDDQTVEQNSFFQLPTNWIWGKLEDLVLKPKDDIVDGPFGSDLKASSYIDSGIPIIRLQNIDRNLFVHKNMKYVSLQKAQELKRHNFSKGDVVITKLGAPLGKACIVPEYIDRGIIVADVVRLRVPEELVSKKYLVYAINSEIVSAQLKRKTKGTTRPRVNLNHIRKLAVPVAPLNEQRQIVVKVEELFSFLDAGVDSLRRVQTQLKRYRQAVLKYAFEGKLTEEWRKNNKEKETAQEILNEISKNKGNVNAQSHKLSPVEIAGLPSLPESWKWARTSDICRGVVPGRNKPKKFRGEIPWLTPPDIAELYISKSRNNLAVTKEDAEDVGMRVMPKGTVLMSCVGRFGLISIANCSVVPNQQFHGFICPANIQPEYIAYSLMSQIAQMERVSSATTIAYMNKDKCNNIIIPLAPSSEQQIILQEIELGLSNADKAEETVVRGLKMAESLRQSILREAFKGRLVRQDPNDESAEKLLERIKTQSNSGIKTKVRNQLESSKYVK